MHQNIHSFMKPSFASFNIIEEFAALNAQRKLSLCDCLFTQGSAAYAKSAGVLWPQATPQDVSKLEKFLILLKKSAH